MRCGPDSDFFVCGFLRICFFEFLWMRVFFDLLLRIVANAVFCDFIFADAFFRGFIFADFFAIVFF